MTAPSIYYIEDMSTKDVELLAQLLSLTPGQRITSSWLRDQAHCISTFPRSLLKPSALLPRLAMSLPFTAAKAKLCETHKPLNSHLIRRIFLLVVAECTTRLKRLVENTHLDPQLAAFLTRIRTTNSLWMSSDLYRVAFNAMPADKRFDRISCNCEACILASVGGNHQILSDLRASMLGRKRKRRRSPRMLPLVEEWIDWTGNGETIRAESQVLGIEIRECRRQMQNERRQKQHNIAEGKLNDKPETGCETLVDERGDELMYWADGYGRNDKDEHDFESSIIDFYSNLMSTASLAPGANPVEGIHPAFRDSIILPPITETSHQATPAAKASHNHTAYSESAYTNSEFFQKDPAIDLDKQTVESRAKAYRKLVGTEDEDEDKARTRRESKSASRMTRWSDFK